VAGEAAARIFRLLAPRPILSVLQLAKRSMELGAAHLRAASTCRSTRGCTTASRRRSKPSLARQTLYLGPMQVWDGRCLCAFGLKAFSVEENVRLGRCLSAFSVQVHFLFQVHMVGRHFPCVGIVPYGSRAMAIWLAARPSNRLSICKS
jgi:hypothetical protein